MRVKRTYTYSMEAVDSVEVTGSVGAFGVGLVDIKIGQDGCSKDEVLEFSLNRHQAEQLRDKLETMLEH